MQEELIEHELPPRPRHRLLGVGGNPLAVALLCVLLCACGFIGGVLVEKGQAGSGTGSGSEGGLASRLAALRSGGSGSVGAAGAAALAGGGRSGGGSGGAGGGAGGLFGSGGASGGTGTPATIGQVAYVAGDDLYVTDFEGNTIKVATSAATKITRTVRSSARAVHPGETVIVTGSSDQSGTVHAQSVRASEAGAGGGGLGAALFGVDGSGGGSSSSSGRGGSSSGNGGSSSGNGIGGGSSSSGGGRQENGGGGEGPALFGK